MLGKGSGGGGGGGYSASEAFGVTGYDSTKNEYITPITGAITIETFALRPWTLSYTNITSATLKLTGSVTGYAIAERAFSFCYSLEDVLYFTPNERGGIGTYAFYLCKALKRVRIVGNPTTIASNAFGSCAALTDIYVSFSEGAVANAPWGATNATVHYDTVFDSEGNIVP